MLNEEMTDIPGMSKEINTIHYISEETKNKDNPYKDLNIQKNYFKNPACISHFYPQIKTFQHSMDREEILQ